MSRKSEAMQIVITPQVCVSLQPYTASNEQHEPKPIQSDIPMVWVQDGMDFRLDITLPNLSVLEILFPMDIETLHVNGKTIWGKSVEPSGRNSGTQVQVLSSGLQLTCTSGGPLHILATFSAKSEPRRSEIRNGAN
jgi:hypothetical protein